MHSMQANLGDYARKLQERGDENKTRWRWLAAICSCRTTPLPYITSCHDGCNWMWILNPPHSPGMVPSDFYLFPKLKSHLCGTQYGSNEGVIEAVLVQPKRVKFAKLSHYCVPCPFYHINNLFSTGFYWYSIALFLIICKLRAIQ